MPSLVFFSSRPRTEQRKKNSINRGHIHIDRFESLPDTFAKGQVEQEQQEKKERKREEQIDERP
jgi:hypothetical protein